jgi:hypothetical protein
MIRCPICDAQVSGPRGLAVHFRHNADTHPSYQEWKGDQRWAGKVEGEDFLRCLVCGHRAASLALHLKSAHGINAGEYRERFPGAEVRPSKVRERRSEAIRGRRGGFGKGEWKEIVCPSCGSVWEGSKFLVPGTHNLCCLQCKREAEDAKWEGKVEGEDFVVCLRCGHKAENLTAHITSRHPGYRGAFPTAPIVAQGSAIRDKTALKGGSLSDETRKRMSENAGRWNKGLTKETDPRVAAMGESLRGRESWNAGLTVGKDERLQRAVEKLKLYVGENRPWHNGLRADLTLADFAPFLDDEGRVDRRAISEATGLAWKTILSYMASFDLETSDKYIRERAEAQVIRIEKGVLEGCRLGNGKVSVALGVRKTGHCFTVVKRECERHGLETFTRRGQQTLCLEAVKEALGGVEYQDEWEAMQFTNPKSGRRFRFDGYFRELGLIVEFHGHQHFLFPNAFMVDESYESLWLEMRERDRIKKGLVDAAGGFTYFMVRYDEPFDDPLYLRYRLVKAGVVSPEVAACLEGRLDPDVFDLFSY